MSDLMDRVLAAYLDDGWSTDDFPQELFQQQEALSRVVSLVIEEAAKKCDDHAEGLTDRIKSLPVDHYKVTLRLHARNEAISCAASIRSLLNKGE